MFDNQIYQSTYFCWFCFSLQTPKQYGVSCATECFMYCVSLRCDNLWNASPSLTCNLSCFWEICSGRVTGCQKYLALLLISFESLWMLLSLLTTVENSFSVSQYCFYTSGQTDMSQSRLHLSSYISDGSCNHLKLQNKYIQRDNISFRVNQLEEKQTNMTNISKA